MQSEKGKRDWDVRKLDFLRLPAKGEYIALDGSWFEVQVVVHCPELSNFAAEIYATKVENDPGRALES